VVSGRFKARLKSALCNTNSSANGTPQLQAALDSRAHLREGCVVKARETKADADTAKVLTMDEARRVASNIAKLPTLLS
jgi:hypothetical protein